MNLACRSLALLTCLSAQPLLAAEGCRGLPNYEDLSKVLQKVVQEDNAGIFKPNAMWASVVDRSGQVCAVAKVGDAWPGSRVIAVQKASTANAFSNEKLALSTANLYAAVQPGGSLYGLQFSNPVDPEQAYKGDAKEFGTKRDPLQGKRIGGVNVFGGGLALYNGQKQVVGGIGVSGDTSCSDHIIAWKIRKQLSLDKLPGGVSPKQDDNIIYDLDKGQAASGFGHPSCGTEAQKVSAQLVL